jgi:hypothetical protein
MVVPASYPCSLRGIKRRIVAQASLGKNSKPYLKKRLGVVIQVVKYLPSKLEALSSNSSTAQKRS